MSTPGVAVPLASLGQRLSCALRIAQNVTGGSGCTELNACLDNPPTSKDIMISDAVEAARYRYICYNIWYTELTTILGASSELTDRLGINYFFSNWYQGMYNAAIEAGDLVINIVQTIDPQERAPMSLSAICSAH